MAFNAALAAKRGQAARPRSTFASARAASSTNNISTMINNHRNKVAAEHNITRLARSETLSTFRAETECLEVAAACGLARYALDVIAIEAELNAALVHEILKEWTAADPSRNWSEDDFAREPELKFPGLTWTVEVAGANTTLTGATEYAKFLLARDNAERAQRFNVVEANQTIVDASDLGMAYVSKEDEFSFEDEFERVSSGESDSDPESTADMNSVSAHSRGGSSASASSLEEHELCTQQSSPDHSIEVEENGSSKNVLRSSASLRRTQPWRSRRALAVRVEESVASLSVAQQQTTTQHSTQSEAVASKPASTSAATPIDWSVDEDDDSFFSEPLAFDGCTYTFQANGVARTPAGATEPDALLVAVPTAVRNHSRTFLKEVAYEKAQAVTSTVKARSNAARAGGSSARPAVSDAVAAAQIAAWHGKTAPRNHKGRKQQTWRYDSARDD